MKEISRQPQRVDQGKEGKLLLRIFKSGQDEPEDPPGQSSDVSDALMAQFQGPGVRLPLSESSRSGGKCRGGGFCWGLVERDPSFLSLILC